MFLVQNNIPFKFLKTLTSNIEELLVKINLPKKNWLIWWGYKIEWYRYDIDKILDSYIGDYDNFLFSGDFNSEFSERKFSIINNLHSLYNKYLENLSPDWFFSN